MCEFQELLNEMPIFLKISFTLFILAFVLRFTNGGEIPND